MVYYFETRDGHLVYIGKDKYENEDLIKYGWPEDIWFHADDHSSAHIYLRLKEGETFETIPKIALEDCCQLTKHGSIQGSKLDKITIVYTPWSNLKKDPSSDVGSVGYHNYQMRKLIKDVEKNSEVLKILGKTKKEEYPNFQELKEQHVQELQRTKNQQFKQQQKELQQKQFEEKEKADLKSYKELFKIDNYKSNKEQAEDEDDFM